MQYSILRSLNNCIHKTWAKLNKRLFYVQGKQFGYVHVFHTSSSFPKWTGKFSPSVISSKTLSKPIAPESIETCEGDHESVELQSKSDLNGDYLLVNWIERFLDLLGLICPQSAMVFHFSKFSPEVILRRYAYGQALQDCDLLDYVN